MEYFSKISNSEWYNYLYFPTTWDSRGNNNVWYRRYITPIMKEYWEFECWKCKHSPPAFMQESTPSKFRNNSNYTYLKTTENAWMYICNITIRFYKR